MDAAGWANVIALFALGSALVGWFTNTRAVRAADKHATAALEASRKSRQEVARAADAQEHMALAMEKTERRVAEVSIPTVAWAIIYHRGTMFQLENTGTAQAYDVDITAPGVARFDGPTHWTLEMSTNMAPGESVEFSAMQVWGGDDTIIVTWADAEGAENRHTWQRPLPPKH